MKTSRLCRAAVSAFLLVVASALPLRAAGQPVPDFTLTTVEGEAVGPPAAGEQPLVVYFMATGCTDCAVVAEDLGRVTSELGDRAPTVVAVDVNPYDSADDLREFAQAVPGVGFRWALDDRGRVARAFGVTALDTTVVIRPGGEIAFRSDGPLPYEALKAAIEAALA